MSLSNAPRLLKAGLVLLDPMSGAQQALIAFQYNPDTLTRTLSVQTAGGEAGQERAQPPRFKGPAQQTLKFDAELDASDALAAPERNAHTVKHGLAPQLALLERLVNPKVAEIEALQALSAQGVLEILPAEAPLLLLVWSANRVLPVRITDLSITEEAFDAALNPIRARVSLGLKVLSHEDLGWNHRGGKFFMTHLRSQEALAGKTVSAGLGALGLDRL